MTMGTMDPSERIVLRRKKLMLSTHFTLSDEQLDRIAEAKLLKRTDYDLIKGEPTNIARVGRLVDVVPVEGFVFLCDLVAEQNEWLSDELKTELKAELGQIQVEDYISKESNVLVHREFGASKRLAQNEKLKLSALVAARTQFAKDVWRQQLERARAALEETKKVNAEKDFRAQSLAARVDSFLSGNRQRLRRTDPRTQRYGRGSAHTPPDGEPGQRAEVKSSPTPSPRGNAAGSKKVTIAADVKENGTGNEPTRSDREGNEEAGSNKPPEEPVLVALQKLGEMIEEVIKLTEECAADREGLRAERARLLETLKLENDDELTPVDSRLKEMLATAAHELEVARDKVRFREERTAELEHRLHEYWIESERTVETKDETISKTAEQLKGLQDRTRELQLSVMKLEGELRGARNELKQYKDKTARLERNRRLGYKSEVQTSGVGAAPSTRFPAIKDGDRTRSVSARRRGNPATPWQVIEN